MVYFGISYKMIKITAEMMGYQISIVVKKSLGLSRLSSIAQNKKSTYHLNEKILKTKWLFFFVKKSILLCYRKERIITH